MNPPNVTDHRDCPTVAVVGDDQPLGEHPPVTWWQVQNIPYGVYVEIIVPVAISAIEATLDVLSTTLFGNLCTAPRDREHITQKPLEVMLHLTEIVDAGELILDPFMGAGTTGVAAVMRGARFIGADHHVHNVEISERRIRGANLTAAPTGDQTAIDFGAPS
ncbi:DNA methyltransferase [Mycobacteroides abscessus]|uniref:DNA methyltransferase n=1 Tax=Mycobacteroides abscessus TaxID=36809 RepID=UPI0009A94711|nr:DNA methyltransferase [Mycobacteroides abscessus]